MTVPIEDLVRDAQRRQADRAVSPERIRAALPRRRRRYDLRRRGTIAAFAAVVAVAAAVAGPALVLGRHGAVTVVRPGAPAQGRPSTAPATAPATPSTPPAPPTVSPAPLGFTIGSPPSGLVERIRWADTGGGQNAATQTRMWSSLPVDDYGDLKSSRLLLRVERTTGDGGVSGLVAITVGGKPGWYDGIDAPDKSYVSWKPDPDTLLTVEQHGLGLSRSRLVTLAESVRPDSTTLAPVATFGWLPGAFSVNHLGLSGNSGTSWRGELSAVSAGAQDGRGVSMAGPELSLTLGSSTTETGQGEPVTVRGHTGKLVTDDSQGPALSRLTLVVDLGGGTWLTLMEMGTASTLPTKADLLHVAEALQLATPDLSWMGR